MANWSKRRTIKAGTSGQRITRTTNSSGKSTYSYSKRVGNTRTTTSISSNGNIKTYVTEHHPTLGVRRTTHSANKPTPAKAYKPNKTPKVRVKKRKKSNKSLSYGKPSAFSKWFFSISLWWWTAAITLLLASVPWFIWLIYFSVFLRYNVDIFK